MKKFTRRVKIQEVFFDKESNDISIHRNKSNRPIYTENHEVNNICNLIEYLQPEKTNIEDNLTKEERQALEELTSNDNIIIKQADKSGNFVLMDKNFYRDVLVLEGHLNSNTYIKVASNEDNVVMTNLKKLIKKTRKLFNEE